MGETKEEKSHIPFRLNVLFFIVFLFFAAIILRLAFVQLVEGEEYKLALEKYSTRDLPISAPRGRILDANGQVLVSNKPVYTVYYVKEQNQDIDAKTEEQTAEKLAKILTIDDTDTFTDKELLQLAVQLQATLPVALNKAETEQLIGQLTPKLSKLPEIEAIDSMSDLDLAKTALLLKVRVKSPFDSAEQARLKASLQKALNKKPEELQNLSDTELLRSALQANIAVNIKLSKEDRDDLIKENKAVLRQFPPVGELAQKSDMDLLQYADFFNLDVKLPLTEQEKKFQWHKLGILKEMRSYDIPSYMPRRVKENISENEMFKIEERRTELPGISVKLEPMRKIYNDPDGSPFGTHILGYTNAIRPDELKEYEAQGYNAYDRVGETGLERYYERYLRGKDGVMEVRVNKNSETVEKEQKVAPEPGDDLVLALDRRFQSKVEDIVKKHFEELKKRPDVPKEMKDIHALVMNPNTGEILAMASYPDYDLNIYYDRKALGFNEKYSSLILPNESNRFINSAYAPGSTVKPLSVMMALQEGLVTPEETIIDRGGWQVGNVFKKNWKTGGHGAVNARRALQVSNNTYMYAMAMRLADRADDYKKQFSVIDFYNHQFGLGVKTGVDLPYEKAGVENPNSYYGNLADAFIGQYDIFTPMQLGQYVSTIANGGYRIRPHLVKEIRKGSTDPKMLGPVLTKIEPEVLNKVDIDPKWIQVVKEGMYLVTQPGGTASSTFRGLPFTVAAKTGTAQTGTGRPDNAVMVGFAPYENPQVVFVVVVPNGLRDSVHSADASGPIARQLLEAYNELYPGVLTGSGTKQEKK
ncbi:peptidoglycan D,D-transpeptidase FtsI family protein [Brevibacillus fulvus]|uniref:Cell division protein FtsI/penicillin-binding protein 2 n=1 Tax=Brevibacillus fulvus TaxID=1125967 RepID=A0A938Y1S2_9BACL|nr:penicillin-binding transpeptidase domain-containing protein [Brevibacillus fulvus]MBM7590022.1 cell division protein FtsI/penicillin-binding protein 2 [Brevibacillus fulvus]